MKRFLITPAVVLIKSTSFPQTGRPEKSDAGKLKPDLKPKPRQDVFVSGDRISEFKEWLGK